ncbi:MAG: hypothetical protein A2252_06940 [Elusimicrobia bacterium RIFOXYA2_FULL_39_19]|nr:MAG: hypothetical protein A2252_06940 [Elusimicrobia bacterium RIFOXYA2_FULL_39_19]
MVYKKIFYIELFFLGILLISGCTKSELNNPNELKVAFPAGGMEFIRLMKNMCKNFQKNRPGLKVKTIAVGAANYNEKIMTMIATDDSPDVFRIQPNYIPLFVKKGLIIDLEKLIEKDKYFDKSIYYPVVLEDLTCNGKLYGLAYGFTPKIIYYNKDLFDSAGVPYPKAGWNWDEYLEIAKKLTIKDSDGNIKQFGGIIEGFDILHFADTWGGNMWNKNKTRCTIDSPAARAGIGFFIDLIIKYHVTPSPRERQSQGDYEVFKNGRGGMLLSGRWQTFDLKNVKNMRWGICEIPQGKRKVNRITANGWVISANCSNQAKAFEILKYICGEENVKYIMKTGDCVPSIIKVAETDFLDKNASFSEEDNSYYLKSISFASSYKKYLHPDISWIELGGMIFGKKIEPLLFQRCDVKTYTEKMQKEINEFLAAKNK